MEVTVTHVAAILHEDSVVRPILHMLLLSGPVETSECFLRTAHVEHSAVVQSVDD